MPIRTILIDDEPLAIAELEHMLKSHSEVEIVGRAAEADEAITQIRELQPDLIFLDINMPEKDGFQLLSMLDEAPMVVFVTAYDEFAVKAFEVNALDYILKPVNKERLAEAIEKVNHARKQQASTSLPINKRIFIKDGEQCYFIPLQEIAVLESAGNYAKLYFRDKRPMIHRSLNYMEQRLPDSHFFRASRQFIINIECIQKIDPYFNNTLRVTMNNGLMIDISQRQSIRFKELMGV